MTLKIPSMRRIFLPSHFLVSGLLLLVLAALYVFFQARSLKQAFLIQTEDKGVAVAKAMEASVRSAIVGNALLEDLIGQRLFDNARLIDQLLRAREVDEALLRQISAMNRLQKIDLLNQEGQPWDLAALSASMAMARVGNDVSQRQQMKTVVWGKRWQLANESDKNTGAEPPARIKQKDFWKGSAFGAAVGARSFPGIIAVHANADYILNFEKEIGVQTQIENLGKHSDSEFIAFLDSNLNVVAHTDRGRIGQQEKDPLLGRVKANGKPFGQVVVRSDGKRYFEVVEPVANLGFLKIGLSVQSMEAAWQNSLQAIVILGIAIVAAGILGMAAIFHNQNLHLQEVKALEIEVLRTERLSALGNVAATVAHEVRNPLNAISMGLQRLKLEFQPTEDRHQYSRLTELMLGESRRINSIVEQFLALARPVELKTEPLPLQEVLKELAALEEQHARQSNVRIEIIAASDLPALKADPSHLTQVLLNLMVNGIQAMPQGGTLTLEAKRSNGNILIAVTDTGTGIAPEHEGQIFDPYFTTKVQGTGLGLAISRRLIEAHGGTIKVAKQASGGSRFEISLPLNRAEV
ncbi:MAG: sensor histidine kinase [Candidatus Binatia bacterium]